MITSYEFPNQWNWRIFLIICDNKEHVSDIIMHLKEKEQCKINEDNVNVNVPCFICNVDELIGAICIDEFNFTSKDISICVHELIHLMIYISSINKCEINLATNECWAYFIGYMVELMIDILKDHFKIE